MTTLEFLMNHATPPADARQMPDGFFYKQVDDKQALVCEDCWRIMPRYVDFPQGLTSPESDGDPSGNYAKKRLTAVEGMQAVEPLRRAVCLDCYFEAFQRVYPDATLPELSPLAYQEVVSAYVEAPPVAYVGEPRAGSV